MLIAVVCVLSVDRELTATLERVVGKLLVAAREST